jgi:UDP-N-acetylglucosamine 4-epimerase
MKAYQKLQADLADTPQTWLVTGAAGFIGSHLVETLLKLGQNVRGLDNFATGRRENVSALPPYTFIEGDLRDPDTCAKACAGVDYVLHQGALGSVPRSIDNPLASHESNVNGTLNIFIAARDAKVKRVVYASSSSVYGDEPNLPKIEDRLGSVISPYAATKLITEIYAGAFAKSYGLETIGLRYFNVFGARQDPEGAYAAVIPKWVAAMLRGEQVIINGDGETSRDFCYIDNVVQMNLLSATSQIEGATGNAYNVAVHHRTSLNELFEKLRALLQTRKPGLQISDPDYREFRPGDVRHSLADISKANRLVGYEPTHLIDDGLTEAIDWYIANVS